MSALDPPPAQHTAASAERAPKAHNIKIIHARLYGRNTYQVTVYGLLPDAVLVRVRFVEFGGAERVRNVQGRGVEPAVLVTGVRGGRSDVRRR